MDDEGIQASADYISRLVRQEMEAGMPSSRIVVGGFSQVRRHGCQDTILMVACPREAQQ